MNKIKLAYVAGLIDADGCIMIGKDSWRERNRGIAPAYFEHVSISQCDPAGLKVVQELFGGKLGIEQARAPSRRPMHRWQARHTTACDFVRAILPYLRIKRREAELMLALRALKNRGRKANTYLAEAHVRRLLPEVLDEMESLYGQVRELKRTR